MAGDGAAGRRRTAAPGAPGQPGNHGAAPASRRLVRHPPPANKDSRGMHPAAAQPGCLSRRHCSHGAEEAAWSHPSPFPGQQPAATPCHKSQRREGTSAQISCHSATAAPLLHQLQRKRLWPHPPALGEPPAHPSTPGTAGASRGCVSSERGAGGGTGQTWHCPSCATKGHSPCSRHHTEQTEQ